MADTIGRLGYVGPMAVKPINHPVSAQGNLNLDWREMPVRDAGTIPGGATLERNAFTALPHHSGVKNWDGDAWLEGFAQEALALVKSTTGAAETAMTQNNGRGGYPFGKRSSKFDEAGGPLGFAHNDFTAGSGPRHLAADYPDRAEALYKRRFAIYNVWHLISHPPQSHPLALCEPTSIAISDIVAGEAHYGSKDNPGYFGENTMLRYNPAHRWYYYPDLRPDQTLVWCGYNSDPSRPSIVPHSSFRDPNVHDPKSERTVVHGTVYAFFG